MDNGEHHASEVIVMRVNVVTNSCTVGAEKIPCIACAWLYPELLSGITPLNERKKS